MRKYVSRLRRWIRIGVRHLTISLAGGVLIVAGAIMLVTPGPGLLTIAAGLAVLAREYGWAAELRDRTVARLRAGADRVRQLREPGDRPEGTQDRWAA